MKVLQIVVDAGSDLSLNDLSFHSGFAKPTVFRIANNLVQLGLLYRDPAARRFSPGPALHDLALRVLFRSSKSGGPRAAMEALAMEVGETVNLGVLQGSEVMYVERVESRWPLRIAFHPGSRVPIHCTALGKLLLAFSPGQFRTFVLSTVRFRRFTRNTVTDPAVLERELRRIRGRGFSVDNEEYMDGVRCLAVPILGLTDHALLALSISGPSVRLPLAKLYRLVSRLCHYTGQIGEQMNLGGSEPGKISRARQADKANAVARRARS